MTDKELADRVVALGVGNRGKFVDKSLRETGEASYFPPGGDWGMPAETFIGSPRVAMALMEQCQQVNCWREDDGRHSARAWKLMELDGHDSENQDSRARAIIEACVKALEAR